MSNSIFGFSERALELSEMRAVQISNNITNSTTPNYKAKDIDFQQALTQAGEELNLTQTNSQHIAVNGGQNRPQMKYRMPTQESMDGNTVDPELERKNFMQNSIRYQVNLTFIQNKTDELMKAIKGEI
jgi:flagellar basal-body rod protein FlgB